MIVSMSKKEFDSLPNEAVGHACFEPLITVYQGSLRRQSGRETSLPRAQNAEMTASRLQEYRVAFYKSLSQGQRALWMFFSYYDHAIRSKDEFLRISKQYLSTQIFGAVKKGMEYFKDDEILHLLSRIEQDVSGKEQNQIISSHVDELYAQFQKLSPDTVARIGSYVKENPGEFITFE